MLDLDNTLGNRQAAIEAWTREFVKVHRLNAAANDWILQADNDGYSQRSQVFAQIRDRYGLTASVDDLVASYQERVVELAATTVGATDCLVELRRRGHALAIVTNGSSKQQHAKIDIMGLRPLVDAVVVSGDLDIQKPDRAMFDAAATETGTTLAGAWMVGDSAIHDVGGAQPLGVNTVWLHRSRPWPHGLEAPTAIIGELTELVAVLDAQQS